MKLASLLIVIALVCTGCPVQGLDKVMGNEAQGTPVKQEQRIDCDLIFPGPDHR